MKQNTFKNFMSFSKSERIAIITIVSLIVIVLIIKYLLILNPPKRDYFKHDLDSIIARREMVLDSVRRADSIEKANAKHNEIPRYARNDNGSTVKSSKKDKPKYKENPHPSGVRNEVHTIDLNAADTTMLQQLPGIGAAYAKWIVDYREKLGGYCETEQLLEVYRMDTNRFNDIERFIRIDSTFIPNRLKINSDAFKVLLKHPYLEYDDVKKIVNYREQKGLITSWQQLERIVGDGINPKLQYYVDYQ